MAQPLSPTATIYLADTKLIGKYILLVILNTLVELLLFPLPEAMV